MRAQDSTPVPHRLSPPTVRRKPRDRVAAGSPEASAGEGPGPDDLALARALAPALLLGLLAWVLVALGIGALLSR